MQPTEKYINSLSLLREQCLTVVPVEEEGPERSVSVRYNEIIPQLTHPLAPAATRALEIS
jgi:hypothetical protein